MSVDASNGDSDPIERFKEELRISESSRGKSYSQSSIDRYEWSIGIWQDWLEEQGKTLFDDVSTRDVKLFLTDMAEDDYSESSVLNARSAISKFFQLCRPDDPNPVDDLDRSWSYQTEKEKQVPDGVEYLTPEEVEALIDNVRSPTLRNELLCKILYMTGIRRSELITLELGDVDLDAQTFDVWDEKANTKRTVGFRQQLKRPLQIWIDTQRPATYDVDADRGYLFPSKRSDSGHISGVAVRDVVVDAAESAGLQEVYGESRSGSELYKIGPHSLRHSFAVECAKQGIPAPFVRDQLGHHDLSVTDIYTSLAEEDAAEKIGQQGPTL